MRNSKINKLIQGAVVVGPLIGDSTAISKITRWIPFQEPLQMTLPGHMQFMIENPRCCLFAESLPSLRFLHNKVYTCTQEHGGKKQNQQELRVPFSGIFKADRQSPARRIENKNNFQQPIKLFNPYFHRIGFIATSHQIQTCAFFKIYFYVRSIDLQQRHYKQEYATRLLRNC